MLISRISVVSESQWKASRQAVPDDRIPFEETVEVARVLMEAFWQEQLPDDELIPDLDLGEGEEGLYKVFLERGLRFSIGHEFGHVLLDTSQDWRKQDRQEIIGNWGTEFAADRIGLELSVDIEKDKDKDFRFFQVQAAEWLFVLCDALSRYGTKVRRETPGLQGTHPPSYIRLEHLRDVAGSSRLRHDLGPHLKTLADRILSELDP